ncbi:MAG: YhbY family RNA-binding protein [Chthoniobacteraceae bacterium]
MTDEPIEATSAPAQEPEDPKLKELKARAQLTKATVKVGHDGVSERLIKILNGALDQHELVKVKFGAMKDQKKLLSRVLEQQTNSLMVQRVGHTATYYRARKAS